MRLPAQPAPFRYTERAPSAAMARWVLSLWAFQSDATPAADEPYTVWPDGCTSIAVARGPGAEPMLLCVGPRISAMRPPVSAGRRLWGFRLWPDVVESVTGIEARRLRDYLALAPGAMAERFEGLDAALPHSDDPDVVLPALDRFLSARLTCTPEPDARIRAAVGAIVAGRGTVAMTGVASAAGVGLRHLQRRFPAATGLTLREYARVRRLREALAHRIAERLPGWSRIAAESGFVDHAHLAREFVALTGVNPTVAARQLGTTAHRDVVP